MNYVTSLNNQSGKIPNTVSYILHWLVIYEPHSYFAEVLLDTNAALITLLNVYIYFMLRAGISFGMESLSRVWRRPCTEMYRYN